MLRFYNPDAIKLADQLEAVRASLTGVPDALPALASASHTLYCLAASGLIPPRGEKKEAA
ncbi:hypothetical protein [Magnetospirillum aberrantis]|uniref:Uncharacterized protein n=1 Tax=Magnetospirillum aberrantis SpK TaxID=908842 RepID=A0A7C9UYS5_9PROT|nr:hypothetical protein [Magnetospirillum aberrantis]NFV80051.1 hypothetical protein [Magnetospirillum aberrantis SpK]